MTDDATAPAPARPSAGALLRAAREKQGLHIAALAASIKVAPRKLDALENDRHDELPDLTFVRALALTVCRALKIDAAPVLALLPQPPGTVRLEPAGAGLNAPFRERPGPHEPRDFGWLARPVVWATALVLLAAAAVALLPGTWWARLSAPAPQAGAPAAAPLADPAASAAANAGVPAPEAATPSAAASAPAPEAAASVVVETVHSAPDAGASAPAHAAAPAALLVLRAGGESWVEVQDGAGRTLLSRLLLAGETVGLDGTPPLRLTIGNAAVTQLSFRGAPVELATRTGRDNVARLELK